MRSESSNHNIEKLDNFIYQNNIKILAYFKINDLATKLCRYHLKIAMVDFEFINGLSSFDIKPFDPNNDQ